MVIAPIPENEPTRLRWLEELDIFDTTEEQAYDDITALAAQICQTPIALVSLIDRDRQWFKSHHGLAARETPRDYAFCSHAILGNEVFVVEDSALDERFRDNPLFTGAPHVAFYAGAPLSVEPGVSLGTLCVIDHQARELTPSQRAALEALARQVVTQFELRMKLKELGRLDRAKDEFVSMVSHELRTPLTAIKGALGLLKDRLEEIGAEHARELIGVSHRNADRLLMIVNDILDIAKLQAGKLQLQIKSMDLLDLVKQGVELNRPYVEQCGCEVQLKQPEDYGELLVSGDPQRLLQVLGNLISNSAKFTHSGDTIEVSATRNGASAYISVTDHGPGITADKQKDMFGRFVQLSTASNGKMPGTGLGLAICKQIVELHGGSMSFESRPGSPTSFRFSLPLA